MKSGKQESKKDFSRRQKQGQQRPTFKPRIERLEERIAPSGLGTGGLHTNPGSVYGHGGRIDIMRGGW